MRIATWNVNSLKARRELVIDIDQRGRPFDAGWTAEGRIAARLSHPG